MLTFKNISVLVLVLIFSSCSFWTKEKEIKNVPQVTWEQNKSFAWEAEEWKTVEKMWETKSIKPLASPNFKK